MRPEHERWIVAALAAALCAFAARPAAAEPPDPGITPFIKIKRPEAVDLAPDGTVYFRHDPDGIPQLYRVPPGGRQDGAVRLTDFRDGIETFSLSPDGAWIAVATSVGRGEQDDLYLIEAASGRMEPLLVDPDVVYGSVVWRRDSRAFAYRANDVKPRDFHVYVYDLATRTPRKVFEAAGSNFPADFSRDGGRLVVGTYHSATHVQLFELDLASGTRREITPAGEQWTFEPVGYDPSERRFLVSSNYQRDLMRLHAIDLEGGEVTLLLPDAPDREVDFGAVNPERTWLAAGINEDGYRTLEVRRLPGLELVAGPEIPKGVVQQVRLRGDDVLFALENATTPGTSFRWSAEAGGAPIAVTEADAQGVDLSPFSLPELVRYPSFDGVEIPAFLYLPPGHQEGRAIPFVVHYHGGPESQFRPSFVGYFLYFLSRGYGVLAPNVRGSSGYGREWMEADDYKDRMVSVRDGVWAARYVIDRGLSAPGRIAARGGSYGGFMVMAVITDAPELFGAASNVVGIVNFETFLEQTRDYRRHLREAEYGPLSDREFLRSISPIHRVDRIQTPLHLAHGLNDPRVPVGEAMQIAVELKKRGLPVEQLYFPDEGHGFDKEPNRLLYYEELARFFEEHLGSGTGSGAPSR